MEHNLMGGDFFAQLDQEYVNRHIEVPLDYDYQVLPRSALDGGGWELRLHRFGVEVWSESFPIIFGVAGLTKDHQKVFRMTSEAVFLDASIQGRAWLECMTKTHS